jgi:hypothetical protein
MDDHKLDSLRWPLAPWFPSWTYAILIVNGAIIVALLAATTWAARRGDAGRALFYRRLVHGSILLTVGGNLFFLLTFAVPPSIVASGVGGIFTVGSLVPMLVWAVPGMVFIDLLVRRDRPR